MGKETSFKPVKLFSGVIYREHSEYERIKWVLEEHFSTIDLESPEIPFDCTDYYNEEMGSPLFRRFVAFKELIMPDQLPGIKLLTNRIEDEGAHDGKRSINLDPGYLGEANVILATTKNHYHRIPLKRGIYAHMEYVIYKKKLTPMEWTYPDYHKPEYIEFFTKLKARYREDLKTQSPL